MGEEFASGHVCPACASMSISPSLAIARVPVHCNLLWSTREQALAAPVSAIELAFCHECGHLFNTAFDADLMSYGPTYENSLHFSQRFVQYTDILASRLVKRYDLYGKTIVEVGCGRGDFLSLLCRLGGNQGIGFDPGCPAFPEEIDIAEQLTFIPGYYSERYAHLQADFVCCRHTLEHVADPYDFVIKLHRAIEHRADSTVYFEVPNGLHTLRELAIWDIIYEHVSYFWANSLERLFARCGFQILEVGDAFGGQFLYIEARPAARSLNDWRSEPADVARLEERVRSFDKDYRSKINAWQRILKKLRHRKQKAVVWGSGSKGVTFLNALETGQQIEFAVDISPRKQGKYIAGTGQKIVPPEFLNGYQPDLIIVMNRIYRDEIHQLVNRLGLSCEILCA